jgi:hypothetical protein
MKKPLLFSVLLSMLLSAACMAAEPTVCKSICAEEKRECRSSAHAKSQLDDSPVIQNAPSANRDARALGQYQGTPQDAKTTVASEFRKRKMEREQACDGKAQACARACTSPEPASVVLTPKTQH